MKKIVIELGEVPEKCYDCPCFYDCDMSCRLLNVFVGLGKCVDCPIKEVEVSND